MGVPFPALKTMVTVFLLLMGNASPVHSVISASLVASIASSVITAGTSVASTALQAVGGSSATVTCVIQVENWTRFALKYPTVLTNGAPPITNAPTAILPTKIEAFAVEKPRGTATGTSGTVSWELQGMEQRIVLMWSAPFSFDLYSNWMGVGMTREGLVDVASGDTWYKQMYYKDDSEDLTFERGKFYYNLKPVIYRNDKFEIVGTMTNIHKAQIKVIIRPTINNWKDMALPIQEMLVKQEKEVCNITTA
uniref:Conoporin n=1 Tax=Conus monile TaxID=351660 RepID=A0A168L5A9_CONMO|nr:conoporin [Conus monile]